MLGKAGLNVTTNGILLDSFLVDILSALLRGIWPTLSISVFVSSLDKMTCECIGPCVEELIR